MLLCYTVHTIRYPVQKPHTLCFPDLKGSGLDKPLPAHPRSTPRSETSKIYRIDALYSPFHPVPTCVRLHPTSKLAENERPNHARRDAEMSWTAVCGIRSLVTCWVRSSGPIGHPIAGISRL